MRRREEARVGDPCVSPAGDPNGRHPLGGSRMGPMVRKTCGLLVGTALLIGLIGARGSAQMVGPSRGGYPANGRPYGMAPNVPPPGAYPARYSPGVRRVQAEAGEVPPTPSGSVPESNETDLNIPRAE